MEGKLTIDQFIERINQWVNETNITNLNQKWINAKLYLINHQSNFEERKNLDLLINKLYQEQIKKIEENEKKV